MEESRIHFYQTGTFTVGNRLLDEKLKTLQSASIRWNRDTAPARAAARPSAPATRWTRRWKKPTAGSP